MQLTIPTGAAKMARKRKMPRRNSKGQFVKGGGGRKPARRRRRSRANMPARKKNGQFKRSGGGSSRRRAPARRRSRRNAPRDPRTGRYLSKSNPGGALGEIAIAGVVVGGLEVLARMFLAPRWPKITMWGLPIAQGIGGWYLREKTKMRDAGTVLLGTAVAEFTVLLVGWATGAIAGVAAPAPNGAAESAAWFRLNGNFPRGGVSHPMSTPGKLSARLANRRPTDALPVSGVPNLATSM